MASFRLKVLMGFILLDKILQKNRDEGRGGRGRSWCWSVQSDSHPKILHFTFVGHVIFSLKAFS